jgi:hypothetical protein
MPDAAEPPEALEVVLRKLSPMAPPFHRHIARGRLVGGTCRVGDRVVVYEVARTAPAGEVRVTDKTVLRFE